MWLTPADMAAKREQFVEQGVHKKKQNPEESRRLQSIVDRMAEQIKHIPRLPEHRKNIPWKVVVVWDDIPNAMAAPNGTIVVNTGAA